MIIATRKASALVLAMAFLISGITLTVEIETAADGITADTSWYS